jgi:hypothetical protein
VQKPTAAFPDSTESRNNAPGKQHPGNWGVYAAAAGAALAMSTNASAEIFYSGAEDVTVSVAVGGGPATQPFTVAGFNERLYVHNVATHILGVRSGTGFASDVVSHRPPPPNLQFFAAQSQGDAIAKAYALGHMITGGDASFGPGALLRQHTTINNVGAFGPGTKSGFVGFKVSSGALAGDLGWVQVKVSDAGSPTYPTEVEVLGWAYDDSGAAIAAGDVGTPEPGTAALGLLAFGALGILALRKRRNELAAK